MAKSKDGKRTGEFGLRLTNTLNEKGYPNYTVYYDHGDEQKHKNVAKVKGFCGDEVTMGNRLAGIDIILVGDSLGMTTYGYDSTLPVTMDLIIPHTKAVRKGSPSAYLIGDMPYMTYQVSIEEAVRNAGRFMADCGCDAVKLEGGREVLDTVKALTKATIPVVGHLGLTPQSIAMFGGFKAQGRSAENAARIIEDAKALEEAGTYDPD